VVALVLLSLVVALGIATRSGRPLPGLPRFAVTAVHRSASLLAVVFVAVHVLTLLFDPYAQLDLISLLVPFTAGAQPFWYGLGAVALDLILALVATSLLRGRLGPRVWRGIHWSAYAAWPIALAHGLGSGSEPEPAGCSRSPASAWPQYSAPWAGGCRLASPRYPNPALSPSFPHPGSVSDDHPHPDRNPYPCSAA
jgi:methionine sulfoxide reductase heme-binding subunit